MPDIDYSRLNALLQSEPEETPEERKTRQNRERVARYREKQKHANTVLNLLKSARKELVATHARQLAELDAQIAAERARMHREPTPNNRLQRSYGRCTIVAQYRRTR